MLGALVFTYIAYRILTSWIFWSIVGGAALLFGFVVSPFIRTVVALVITLSVIMFFRQF